MSKRGTSMSSCKLPEPRKRLDHRGAILLSVVLFLIVFITAFTLGNYPVTVPQVVTIFLHKIASMLQHVFEWIPLPEVTWKPAAETAVLGVRFPRVLAAGIIGGGLSAAGLCYQGLFRNPMVSPDVLSLLPRVYGRHAISRDRYRSSRCP